MMVTNIVKLYQYYSIDPTSYVLILNSPVTYLPSHHITMTA